MEQRGTEKKNVARRRNNELGKPDLDLVRKGESGSDLGDQGLERGEVVLNRQEVGELGLVLGQNFVCILPTFISANNKTFLFKMERTGKYSFVSFLK